MTRPRVLVTRQPEQAGSLRDSLLALGADVLEVPLIEVVPPDDLSSLDEALDARERYDWVAFTSANAVEAVARRLQGRAWPPRCRLASVGPATTAAIRERLGAAVALQPPADHRAEGLLRAFEALEDEALAGRRILLPLSDKARDTLASGLRARGAVVDAVTAYRTVPAPGLGGRLAEALAAGVDLVTFASPSAVEGFVAALPGPGRWPPAAVIGPVTEQAARRAGFDVAAVAVPSTADGLVSAVRAWMSRQLTGGR